MRPVEAWILATVASDRKGNLGDHRRITQQLLDLPCDEIEQMTRKLSARGEVDLSVGEGSECTALLVERANLTECLASVFSEELDQVEPPR